MLIGVVLAAGMVRFLRRFGAEQGAEMLKFLLASGALSLFVALAPFQEIANATRPDDTSGMTLVGVFFALFLIWLGVKIRRRALLVSTKPQTIGMEVKTTPSNTRGNETIQM